jgi:hypothetical protein
LICPELHGCLGVGVWAYAHGLMVSLVSADVPLAEELEWYAPGQKSVSPIRRLGQ